MSSRPSAQIRPRRYKAVPPPTKTWEVAGWRGMYDSRGKKAEREEEAPILINLSPLDPDRAGPLILCPGMQRLVTPTTTQIGTAASWQGVAGIYGTPGPATHLCVVVAGGEIYTLNIPTGVLTKVITTAQLTAAAITLSSTNRVHIVQFGLTALIADEGNNAPFTWDGTVGGGLVKLTNAPALRIGAPTVYYSKIFFIKNPGTTLVWSEENQPNTGYEAGGFNNAWQLVQTGAALMTAILGTNEGLYYWRPRSVGVIRGAVSSTFQTDGVHDSIAEQVGILGGTVPNTLGGAIWWFGADGQLMAYRPDLGTVNLGRQIPRLYGSTQGDLSPDKTYLGSVGEQYIMAGGLNSGLLLPDKASGRMHFETVFTGRRVIFVFDASSMRLLYYRVYPALNAPTTSRIWAATMIDVNTGGAPWIKLSCDAAGFIFKEPLSVGTDPIGFDETHNGAGTAIDGTLIGPMHGWTGTAEWAFIQIDVMADALPNNDLTVGYITSRFHKDNLASAPQTVVDAVGADTPYERRKAFGLKTTGRWLRPIITLGGEATINRLPQLHGYALTARVVSESPAVT